VLVPLHLNLALESAEVTRDVSVGGGAIAAITLLQREDTSMLTHSQSRPTVRVTKDATATIIRATIVDEDGDAINLSGASGSKYFHCSTQAGASVTYQGAASFTTDGTDGKVQFQLTSTEVSTEQRLNCEFEVQGYSGGNLITELFFIVVEGRAAVAP
jgi:hypothetical protein